MASVTMVPINFDKTLQERLQEYKEIFVLNSEFRDETSSQNSVTSYLMKEFWGDYLSIVLCYKGWKAIWKVPIGKCILMNLKRTSNVLVEVISIDWKNLSADVQVLKINEHYVPSSRRIAAICELFPIEEQTTDCDPWLIANELDKYRFFNEYLWYPWDEIEDDIYSWTESHLEQRIQLLYDMTVGEVNLGDSERMRQLISDAQHLQVEFEETERILEELEESNDLNLNKDPEDLEELNANLHQVSMHGLVGKEKKEMLMVRLLLLRRKLEDIQHEFEALENPVLRKVMSNVKLKNITREYQMNSGEFLNNNYNEGKMQKEEIRHIALVCGRRDSKEIRGILDYVESKFSKGANCTVGFFSSLQMAIDLVSSKRTTYVVSPGIHFMEFTEDLLSPGTTLAGFPEVLEQTSSVIRGHSLGRTMMVVDWAEDQDLPNEKQESANLENLHFDPVGIEAVLLVDCGSISVKFCNFGHKEGHHDLPVIGAHNTPSESILPTYSHYHSVWKELESGCGESGRLSIHCLPVSAMFVFPKQQGIAVGAHGELEAKECHFKGLPLAIIAYSGAKVTLSNCRFSQCQVAIRISKGAEVTAEKCVFEHSLANAIQYFSGTYEEQDEETQKIMEGKEEVITSSQILERIPGLTFKDCTFISGDSSDVCLRSLGEIAKSTMPRETISTSEEKKLIEENITENWMLLNETEEDSIIILD